MKRVKRDQHKRAYRRGYISGIRGHGSQTCPYSGSSKRLDWIEGWQAGRSAGHVAGFRGSEVA